MTEEELLVELRKPDTELRRSLGSVGRWLIYRSGKSCLPLPEADPEMVWKMVAKGLLFPGKSETLDFVLVSIPSDEQKWKRLQKIAREIARLTFEDMKLSLPSDYPEKVRTIAIIGVAFASIRQYELDKWLLEGTTALREKETW